MKILGTKLINLNVKPFSKTVAIHKLDNSTYEITISSKPEKGKANKEVIILLAKFFNVSKSKVKIIKGHKSRKKVVEIEFDN